MIRIHIYTPNFVSNDDDFVSEYSYATKEEFLASDLVARWVEDDYTLRAQPQEGAGYLSERNPYSHTLMTVSPDESRWYVVAYVYKGSDPLDLPKWR